MAINIKKSRYDSLTNKKTTPTLEQVYIKHQLKNGTLDLSSEISALYDLYQQGRKTFTDRFVGKENEWRADTGDYLSSVSSSRDTYKSAAAKLQKKLEVAGQYLNPEFLESAQAFIKDSQSDYDDMVSYATNENKTYSQFADKNAYDSYIMGWLAEDAPMDMNSIEARRQKYQSNAARIKELEEKYEPTGVGLLDDIYADFMTAPGSDAVSKQKQEQQELSNLRAENTRYEREQMELDNYYVPRTEAFLQNAAQRDYGNATMDEIEAYNIATGKMSALENVGARQTASGWVDKDGNKITFNYAAQIPSVNDKLGFYFEYANRDKHKTYSNSTDIWASPYVTEGYNGSWQYLTEDEVDIYYDLYKRKGQAAAYQFLDDMKVTLNKRATEAMENDISNDDSALERIVNNVVSIPANVFGGAIAFVDDALNLISGKEINPYSTAHSIQNYAQAVRSDTASDIVKATDGAALPVLGTTWGDAYQALMSTADSLVGTALGGNAYGALMGMGAASSEAKRLYEQGASTGQMVAGGLLAGAAEMVFEKYSIDKLVSIKDSKTIRGMVLNGLKQGGVEASEEMLTEMSNVITNAIVMGRQSDWQKYVDRYVSEGYSGAQAAVNALFGDVAKDVVNAGIAGFISGAASGTVVSASNYVNNKIAIASNGNEIIRQGRVAELQKDAGKFMDDKTVKKYSDAVAKNPTAENVGRLADAVDEARVKKAKATMQAEYEKAGLSREDAKTMAKYKWKEANNIEISQSEQREAERIGEKFREAFDAHSVEINQKIADGKTSVLKSRVNFDPNSALQVFRVGDMFTAVVKNEGADGAVSYSMGLGQKAEDMRIAQGLSADVVKRQLDKLARNAAAAQNASQGATNGVGAINGKGMQQNAAEGEKTALAIEMAKGSNQQTSADKRGRVLFERGARVTTKSQKRAVALAYNLSKALGVDIVFYDARNTADVQGRDANGYFDPKDDSIHLDLQKAAPDPKTIVFTLSHELTHFIKKWSAEKYETFAKFLFDQYAKHGESVEQMLANKKTQLGNVSDEKARDELIADACERLLLDSDAVNKLMELRRVDRSLFDKIKQHVKQILANIRAAFRGVAPNTYEGRALQRMEDVLSDIYKMFEDAAVDAAQNYQTIGSRNLAELSEAVGTDGEPIFQYKAFKADENTYRSMLKKWGKMTDEQISNLFDTVNEAMDLIVENLEVLDYAWESDIDDRAFFPIKQNSDKLYKVSLDFSTLCRKRILQQMVVAQLQEALNQPLTKEEGIAIRDALIALQEEGRKIEVACALCYVESARMKSPEQIKKFLNNREAVIKEFFAGKSGGSMKEKIASAETAAREKLYKENPSGIKGKDGKTMLDPREAKLNQLPKKYADEIRAAKKEAKESYKPTAEEQKVIDAAKGMSVSDFTTPEGLEKLAKTYPSLFDAYTSYVRNATKSKGIENDTWWRAGDSESIGDVLIANMNKENGLRSQSWSDFQVVHILDYIAATIEMATREAKEQAYSKVPDYVELMGKTGVMINMSLVPTAKFDGKLDYDSVEGMAYKRALELRDKYPETAGTICIGIQNEQIRMLLADMTIDYVIPYHKSGMSAVTRKAMRIQTWENYEEYQSEGKLSREDALKNAKKYGVKLLAEDDPNYQKGTSFSEWFDLKEAQQIAKMENGNPSDKAKEAKYGVMYGGYMAMQNAAQNYLKLCAERGLSPKFSHKKADFTSEENYWKLLIDRKMVNNKTGEIIEQKPIKPIFEQSEVMRILNDELARYPRVKEDQEYAIRKVTEKFLSGEVKGGMSAEAIAKVMKKPVDNVTKVNILEAADDGVMKQKKTATSHVPTFYSQMGKVIDNIKMEKIGAASVLNYIKGKGIKNEEIKWSGIEAFLEGKKSVTKKELQEFVAGSMIQIAEELSVGGDKITLEPSKYGVDTFDIMSGGKILDTVTWNKTDELFESDSTRLVFPTKEKVLRYYQDQYENGETRWSEYKLDGGSNYREIVFKLPNSSYSNIAMRGHWGDAAEGVLAHARLQDMTTSDGKKMLFIEEIQSDWHNEGAKKGYQTPNSKTKYDLFKEYEENYREFYEKVEQIVIENFGNPEEVYREHPVVVAEMYEGDESHFDKLKITGEQKKIIVDMVSAAKKIKAEFDAAPSGEQVPDAPFRKNYHEYVLKRLLRIAAEEGYDSIGWTTADIQSKRWSDEFAEGYRIEYDQDIPKFLRKYGEKWGATVGKTSLIENSEVWSMDITDSMKESVLNEGQPLYQKKTATAKQQTGVGVSTFLSSIGIENASEELKENMTSLHQMARQKNADMVLVKRSAKTLAKTMTREAKLKAGESYDQAAFRIYDDLIEWVKNGSVSDEAQLEEKASEAEEKNEKTTKSSRNFNDDMEYDFRRKIYSYHDATKALDHALENIGRELSDSEAVAASIRGGDGRKQGLKWRMVQGFNEARSDEQKSKFAEDMAWKILENTEIVGENIEKKLVGDLNVSTAKKRAALEGAKRVIETHFELAGTAVDDATEKRAKKAEEASRKVFVSENSLESAEKKAHEAEKSRDAYAKTVANQSELIKELKEKNKNLTLRARREERGKEAFATALKNKRERLKEEKAKSKREQERLKKKMAAYDNIAKTVRELVDFKTGRFRAASEYRSDVFRRTIESLAKIDFNKTERESIRGIFANLSEWYNESNQMLVGEFMFDQDIYDDIISIGSGEGVLSYFELLQVSRVLDHLLFMEKHANQVRTNGEYVDAKTVAASKIKKAGEAREGRSLFTKGLLNRIFRGETKKRGLMSRYLMEFGDPMTVARMFDSYDPDGFFTTTLEEWRQAAIAIEVDKLRWLKKFKDFMDGHKGIEKRLAKDKIEYRGQMLTLDAAASLYMTMKTQKSQRAMVESYYSSYLENGDKQDAKGFAPRRTGEEGRLTDKEIERICLNNAEELWRSFDEDTRAYIKMMEETFGDTREIKVESDKENKGYSTVYTDEQLGGRGYYYPTIRDEVARDVEQKRFRVDKVGHQSIDKHVVEGANAGLLIRPASAVLLDHIQKLALGKEFFIPMQNFNRLANVDTGNNLKDPTTIQRTFDRYGDTAAMMEYMRKLASDIQGGEVTDRSAFEELGRIIRSNYAKFQLAANVKTMAMQTTALVAASNILDPKLIAVSVKRSFRKGFGKIVDKYCPLAEVRNSENSAALAQGVLETTGKWGDKLMKGIGATDRMVVKIIYAACQAQVQANSRGKLKIGTEQNNVEAGRLLEKVLLETQQNSLVTERSSAMRSKKSILNTLTMFSADAMKLVGREIDSIGEYSVLHKKWKSASGAEKAALEKEMRRAGKKLARSTAVFTTSAIVSALIAQAFRSLYAKDDDKEDEEIVKQVAADAVGNLFGGLPVIRDAYGFIANGYEVNVYQTSVINDLFGSVSSMIDIGGKLMSGEDVSQQTVMRGIRDVSYAAGMLMGLPVRNIYNTVTGIASRMSPEARYWNQNMFYKQSYKADLEKAIAAQDGDMVSLIASMMIDDKIGNADEELVKALKPYVEKGYDVLPSTTPSKITVKGETDDDPDIVVELNNEQKKQFKQVYDKAGTAIVKLVSDERFSALDEKQKADAISKLYDAYYNEAAHEVAGVEMSKVNVLSSMVDREVLVLSKAVISTIEADVDKRGNAVSGSRKKKVLEYVKTLKLPKGQAEIVLYLNGYRGDAVEGMVAKYANSAGLDEQTLAALAEMMGGRVVKGKIVLK